MSIEVDEETGERIGNNIEQKMEYGGCMYGVGGHLVCICRRIYTGYGETRV